MTTGAREGIAVLDAQTCWRLLAEEEVGRLVVTIGQQPEIFPINYMVDEEAVVFRTAEGTKLGALFIGPAVAFEVDGYNPDAGDAWSVVIKGRAEEIPMHDLLDDAFPLFPWSATPKARFVRVLSDEIAGRRFHIVQRRAEHLPIA